MEKNKNKKIVFLFLFFISNIFCINPNSEYIKENIINEENLFDLEDDIYTKLDEFVIGNIKEKNEQKSYNYSLNIMNEDKPEGIIFDYQSEFGCVNISFYDNSDYNNSNYSKSFCSEGRNELFILDKEEIPMKDEKGNILMNVNVGLEEDFKFVSNFNFNYSLKVSLRKPFNIIEINSDHKTSCKMERNGDKYRCLFVIKNKDNMNENNDLLIFPIPNVNMDNFNIYADYINPNIYDTLNNDELEKNIPNETSYYTNIRINDTNLSYIKINNLNKSQYLYVSVESENNVLFEVVSQIIPKENEYQFPKDINSNFQVFFVNNSEITIKFMNETFYRHKIYITLTTVWGKGIIKTSSLIGTQTNYITDIRDSNLYFYIRVDDKCYDNRECDYTFKNIDEEFIFYITFSYVKNNEISEIIYGKSNRYFYRLLNNERDSHDKLLLYEYIPYINDSINIYFQDYNHTNEFNLNRSYNVEVFILSSEEMMNIKMNYSEINNFQSIAKKQFQLVTFATNIHIPKRDINENNSYVLILMRPLDNNFLNVILGVTISQDNSLIYPSERIYHFGELNSKDRIVYKLKGHRNYRLMRLEFGHNSPDLQWSVKRTNSPDDYKTNDTLLSFVTEYFCNGRELLTMYIEKGEDIYLNIFREKKSDEKEQTLKHNFAFKYVNSAKNGDFKNYIVKDDNLNYDIEERTIKINKLSKIENVKYFMRIIKKNDYIKSENLNTISVIESNGTLLNGSSDSDTMVYNVKKDIDKYKDYEVNCYIVVIDDNNDVELLSYQRLDLVKLTPDEPSFGLMVAALSLAGIGFVIFISRLIHHCCCIDDYYGSSKNKKKKSYYY